MSNEEPFELAVSMKYKEYLQSKEWKQIKFELLHQRGSNCERCLKKTKNLHVHHLNYDRLGFEEPRDLEILCEDCHRIEHGFIPRKKLTQMSQKEIKLRNDMRIARALQKKFKQGLI